ncbi:hypothetical protein EPI10_023903 [Gossypium australe]|uniref:Uncharacterized protein n=1 Tax=Gossypium australe TaxID=47621 RepID=A0A5B6VXI5_9ROSI|nr:hypothetical protein EPI10_023903 [Gossypium australe]
MSDIDSGRHVTMLLDHGLDTRTCDWPCGASQCLKSCEAHDLPTRAFGKKSVVSGNCQGKRGGPCGDNPSFGAGSIAATNCECQHCSHPQFGRKWGNPFAV